MQKFTSEEVEKIEYMYYENKKVKPLLAFEFINQEYVLCDDWSQFDVNKKSSLKKEREKTYEEKNQDKLILMTNKLEEKKDKVVSFLVEKAIADMNNRIKLQIAFGEGKPNIYIEMKKQFEKMIKEEADKNFKL